MDRETQNSENIKERLITSCEFKIPNNSSSDIVSNSNSSDFLYSVKNKIEEKDDKT